MASPETIREHADLVEHLAGTGQCFSLTWRAGDPAEVRMALIDHHGAVQTELRRRGHERVQGKVDRNDPGMEHYAIRLAPDPDDEDGWS